MRKASWVFAAKVLLSLVILVFAASITVTTNTYQAEIGSSLNFPAGLIATDRGFSVALTGGAASGTSCTTPVVFGPAPGSANTTITAGHWAFLVRVNSTGSAPPSQKFNVTLVLASMPYGPLCIQDIGTPVSNQYIDCRFDVGTTLPASPYTFIVAVQ